MPKKNKIPNLFSKARRLFLKRFFNGLFFLGLFILLALVFITFFFVKSWYSESLAKFLPASETVMFAEINLDNSSPAVQNLWKFFGSSQIVTSPQLQLAADYLLPDYQSYQPLLQRRAGLALIDVENALVPVFYGKIKAGQNLQEIIAVFQTDQNSKTLETTLEGQKLISLSEGISFKILEIGDQLFISESLPALSLIASVASGKVLALSSSPAFNQAAASLLDQNLFFAYLDQRILTQNLLHNQNYLDQNIKIIARFLPLLKIYKATAVALKAEPDHLLFRSVSAVDSSLTGNQPVLAFNESYQGKLVNLLGPGYSLLLGGRSLDYEFKRLSELYQGRSSLDEAIFQGEFKALLNLVFPADLDLHEQILPLFKNEYAFAYDFKEQPVFVLLTEISDQSLFLKWQTVEEKLKTKFAALFPIERELTLPDDTVGKELVADPSKIKIAKEEINGVSFDVISGPNQKGPKLFSTYSKGLLMVSNDSQTLLDLIGRQEKLSAYRNPRLLHGADEILVLELKSLLKTFSVPEIIQTDFLASLKFTYSKKYQLGNIIDQLIIAAD